MTKQHKIPGTVEAWENGALGGDAEHIKVVKRDQIMPQIEEKLGLKPISIRLQESLIEDLKLIAQVEGLGYQPLIKQVLQRFVDCEMKRYGRMSLQEERGDSAADDAADAEDPPKKSAVG